MLPSIANHSGEFRLVLRYLGGGNDEAAKLIICRLYGSGLGEFRDDLLSRIHRPFCSIITDKVLFRHKRLPDRPRRRGLGVDDIPEIELDHAAFFFPSNNSSMGLPPFGSSPSSSSSRRFGTSSASSG